MSTAASTGPGDPSGHQPSIVELDRRRYRAKQSTRSVLIALVSTAAFAAVLWVTVVNTPGFSRVQQTFFDPATLIDAFPAVIEGLWLNVRVLFFAAIGVTVLSLLIATVRTLRGPVFFPLRAIAAGYTDFFRGMPLIITLYLVGYGIPGLQFTSERIPAEVLGTAALVLTYSAYVSEVFRAGIDAVHPSQRLAARSLGLSHGKSLRLVVLPQAIRNVTPALMNDFVAMQKDVGLISVLGAVDAVRAAQIETAASYNFTPYVLAGLLFVLLSLPLIRLTDHLTARARSREQIGTIL